MLGAYTTQDKNSIYCCNIYNTIYGPIFLQFETQFIQSIKCMSYTL